MAHIWLQNEAREWAAHLLMDDEGSPESSRVPSDVHFLKTKADNQENWIVIAGDGSDISINGIPLFLGIHVLRDRDEIRWSREGFGFYSSEELASVVSFPQADRKIFCPRCKQKIVPETPAVQCPNCGIWYHQSQEFPCYSYTPNCAICARKTNLGGEFEWIPEI
jgi:hypothetical protein